MRRLRPARDLKSIWQIVELIGTYGILVIAVGSSRGSFWPCYLVANKVEALARRCADRAKDVTMQGWRKHKWIGINNLIHHAINLAKERFRWFRRRIHFSDCYTLDCSKPGHLGHSH